MIPTSRITVPEASLTTSPRAIWSTRPGLMSFERDASSELLGALGGVAPSRRGTRIRSGLDGDVDERCGEHDSQGDQGEERGRSAAQAGTEDGDAPEAGERPDAPPGRLDALRGRDACRSGMRAVEDESAGRQPPPGAAAARQH